MYPTNEGHASAAGDAAHSTPHQDGPLNRDSILHRHLSLAYSHVGTHSGHPWTQIPTRALPIMPRSPDPPVFWEASQSDVLFDNRRGHPGTQVPISTRPEMLQSHDSPALPESTQGDVIFHNRSGHPGNHAPIPTRPEIPPSPDLPALPQASRGGAVFGNRASAYHVHHTHRGGSGLEPQASGRVQDVTNAMVRGQGSNGLWRYGMGYQEEVVGYPGQSVGRNSFNIDLLHRHAFYGGQRPYNPIHPISQEHAYVQNGRERTPYGHWNANTRVHHVSNVGNIPNQGRPGDLSNTLGFQNANSSYFGSNNADWHSRSESVHNLVPNPISSGVNMRRNSGGISKATGSTKNRPTSLSTKRTSSVRLNTKRQSIPLAQFGLETATFYGIKEPGNTNESMGTAGASANIRHEEQEYPTSAPTGSYPFKLPLPTATIAGYPSKNLANFKKLQKAAEYVERKAQNASDSAQEAIREKFRALEASIDPIYLRDGLRRGSISKNAKAARLLIEKFRGNQVCGQVMKEFHRILVADPKGTIVQVQRSDEKEDGVEILADDILGVHVWEDLDGLGQSMLKEAFEDLQSRFPESKPMKFHTVHRLMKGAKHAEEPFPESLSLKMVDCVVPVYNMDDALILILVAEFCAY